MKITVDLTGLARVREQFAALGKAPQQALDVTAVKVEDYVKGQVGKHAKTGMLERSLSKRRITDGWEIGHDSRVAPYARFVHDGTGLWGPKHAKFKIAPKNKKALRWAKGGKFFFARFVMHPGNKPDKWMERAAAQAPNIFRAQLEALIQKA